MLNRLRQVQEIVNDYGWYLVLSLMIALTVTLWRLTKRKKPELEPRYIEMAREGRQKHINRVFVSRAGDALLDAVFDGELGDKEANECFCWLAKSLDQEDQIPLVRAKKTKILKKALETNQRRRALGKKEPAVQLPEPKPDKKPNGGMPDLHQILNS